LTALEPRTALEQKKIMQKINETSERFYKELMRTTPPIPSFSRLMMFRITRTSIMVIQNEKFRDYRYFKQKGWFKSDYYYDTQLGLIKKLAGCFFDFLGELIVKHRRS
jgi:hypothetical protein